MFPLLDHAKDGNEHGTHGDQACAEDRGFTEGIAQNYPGQQGVVDE